jgi:hypothetical protein
MGDRISRNERRIVGQALLPAVLEIGKRERLPYNCYAPEISAVNDRGYNC